MMKKFKNSYDENINNNDKNHDIMFAGGQQSCNRLS